MFISLQIPTLWVLIRSASYVYPQHVFSQRNKKKIIISIPLFWGAIAHTKLVQK